MDPARRYRTQLVAEDAADGCFLFVVAPDDDTDWPDEWVSFEELRPAWRCESCNQSWPGVEFACGYCGLTREDL